jgi:hypothetical protein
VAGPKQKQFVVECHGERHRVQLGRHGVVFEGHPEAGQVWCEQRRREALAALSDAPLDRPLGCYELAALVRERRYVAPGVPKGGARELLALLKGVQAFRATSRRRRGAA